MVCRFTSSREPRFSLPKLRGIGWADTTRLWPKVPITVRDKPPMNFGGDHSAPGWQDCALMHSQATGHGKISPRCVPEGALDGKSATSWQYIAFMYSNTANFGKICVACIQKAPQSAVGECTARASCRQGALSPSEALRSCTAHESCHPPVALPLRRVSCPSNRIAGPPFNGLALAQGCLPPPAPRQHPPLAVPVAARDKPPMSFGGGHPAHGLQFGQAPRDRRLRHLDGQADNGMLRRTGPGFQNREQVGAEPPAGAAGPAGPASALPKTPIERTSPSWRNYRNTPPPQTKGDRVGRHHAALAEGVTPRGPGRRCSLPKLRGIGVVPVYFHHTIRTRLKQHFPAVGSDFP